MPTFILLIDFSFALRTLYWFTPKRCNIFAWLAEVIPVFERPYHRKNSYKLRSDPIFGVYAHEPYGISYKFIKLQILRHQQLTLLIWPRKNGYNRSITVLPAEPNIFDPALRAGLYKF
jgi:hypothetical protein